MLHDELDTANKVVSHVQLQLSVESSLTFPQHFDSSLSVFHVISSKTTGVLGHDASLPLPTLS